MAFQEGKTYIFLFKSIGFMGLFFEQQKKKALAKAKELEKEPLESNDELAAEEEEFEGEAQELARMVLGRNKQSKHTSKHLPVRKRPVRKGRKTPHPSRRQ